MLMAVEKGPKSDVSVNPVFTVKLKSQVFTLFSNLALAKMRRLGWGGQ